MGDEVRIRLSRDQAFVLFDWLARTSDAGQPVAFDDQAEQRVLWDLEALLEEAMVEPLRDDYRTTLEDAWARVRD